MTVLQKIETDLKNAMKSRDSFRLGVLRLIKTEVKNKQIELIRDLNEQEFMQVLSRMVKQRRDSVDQYTKGGREDLAQKEQDEIKVIEGYLPKPLSDEELTQIIQKAIQKTGASSPKEMGIVMKEIRDKTTGRVDGKILADKVKNFLGS